MSAEEKQPRFFFLGSSSDQKEGFPEKNGGPPLDGRFIKENHENPKWMMTWGYMGLPIWLPNSGNLCMDVIL